MKPQDIIFFLLFLLFVYKRNSRWTTIAGIVCLLIAMPLFAKWIFFTAERLTWYAGALFCLSLFQQLYEIKKEIKKTS